MKSNFKKFGKYILLLSSVLILIFSLTACNNKYDFPKVDGGQADKPTESNGGQVVKQGDYIYFVNGKTTNEVENEFGKVLKGAILRAKLAADGSMSDIQTIVPKNVFAKSKENGTNGGFYIFGNTIYYVTPNDEIDKNNNRLNDRLDVWKCNIDGSNTVKLGTPLVSLDYQYKMINGYLVTYTGNEIKIFRLEEGLPEVKTISKATGIILPKTETYVPGQEDYVSDYIFYTRALTEEESDANLGATNNVLCAVKADGTNDIILVDANTKFAGKENDFTIALKNYLVNGDEITIYYTRVSDVPQSAERVYSYTFNKTDLVKADNKVYFDSAKETLISNKAIATMIPFSKDIVLEVREKVIYAYNTNDDATEKSLTFVDTNTSQGTFNGTFVTLNGDYMYYTDTTGFLRLKIANNGEIVDKIDTMPKKIYDTSMANNVFGNELVGNYFYFCNSAKLDYVYRVNVESDKEYTAAKLEKDDDRLNPELVGKMTDEDIKSLEDKEKEDKK